MTKRTWIACFLLLLGCGAEDCEGKCREAGGTWEVPEPVCVEVQRCRKEGLGTYFTCRQEMDCDRPRGHCVLSAEKSP